MFGSDGKNISQNTNDIPDESVHGLLDSEAAEVVQPSTPVDSTAPASDDQPSSDGDGDWQHPGTPLPSSPSYISDVTTPDGNQPQPTATPSHSAPIPPPSSVPQDGDSQATTPDQNNGEMTHELIDIKQQALGQLSPLLSHLDQSPEDKFRTILMMIQASDDQNLVKSAYEAANAIQDEKVRAQALLDIVNEINYFTQQHHQA